MFHRLNRGFVYNSERIRKNPWITVFFKENPFKIKDFKKKSKSVNDRLFEKAYQEFKKQTNDSLNREHLSTKEVRKMVPISTVIAGLGLVTLTYKIVDHLVT